MIKSHGNLNSHLCKSSSAVWPFRSSKRRSCRTCQGDSESDGSTGCPGPFPDGFKWLLYKCRDLSYPIFNHKTTNKENQNIHWMFPIQDIQVSNNVNHALRVIHDTKVGTVPSPFIKRTKSWVDMFHPYAIDCCMKSPVISQLYHVIPTIIQNILKRHIKAPWNYHQFHHQPRFKATSFCQAIRPALQLSSSRLLVNDPGQW